VKELVVNVLAYQTIANEQIQTRAYPYENFDHR